jgi:hypothetical protein
MGLLTERAAKTLLYYFFEMNPTLYGWFNMYLKDNEIPREGNWDDISGETFLRTLLSMQIEETNWGKQVGVENLYNSFGGLIVDPVRVCLCHPDADRSDRRPRTLSTRVPGPTRPTRLTRLTRPTRLTRLTRLVHHPLGQRNIAQRVMEIRGQLAKEMIQDLSQVGEENSLLMRETLLTSLSLDVDAEDPGNPDV